MSKKHLGTGLLILLLAIVCTEPAAAQSGRGRQLRIAERLNGQASSRAANPEDSQKPSTTNQNKVSSSGKSSLNSTLIYHDNGDYHQTRADKRAGWILLGVLAFYVVLGITTDP